MRTYTQTIALLTEAGLPLRELHSETGCVAVTLAAGRIVALAFSEDDPNLVWTHPELQNPATVAEQPDALAGGIGGERLWFSPELDFHWSGRPNWTTFENYRAPVQTDPGAYRFDDSTEGQIALSASMSLPTTTGAPDIDLSISRQISMTRSPLLRESELLDDVQFVGVSTKHELELGAAARVGKVALWHLWQAPVGAVAIAPVQHGWSGKPLSYGRPGEWCVEADHIAWRFGGAANAKLGLGLDAATGRLGLVQRLGDGRWALVVREHPVQRAATYADHPFGAVRRDQVVQMWDGFGFGEVEYHSPALDAENGPRRLRDHDTIWAFGGTTAKIAAIGRALLGVDIERYLAEGPNHEG